MRRHTLYAAAGTLLLVLIAASWWGTVALYEREIDQTLARTVLPAGLQWQAASQRHQLWRRDASLQVMLDPAQLAPVLANRLSGWSQSWRWQVRETRWPLWIHGEAQPEPAMGTTRASPKDIPAPVVRWSVNLVTQQADVQVVWTGWQVGDNRLAPVALSAQGNLHQLRVQLASQAGSQGAGGQYQWTLQPFSLSAMLRQDAPGVWRLASGQLTSQGGAWQAVSESASGSNSASGGGSATGSTDSALRTLRWQPLTLDVKRTLHLTAEQRSQLDWQLVVQAAGWQWQPAGAAVREVVAVNGQLRLDGVDAIGADSLGNWLAQGAKSPLQGMLAAQLLARYGLRLQVDNFSARYNGNQLGGRGRLQLQGDPIPLLSVSQLRKRLQGEGQWQADTALATQPGFAWLQAALQQGYVQQMEKQLEAPWQIKRGKLTVNGQRLDGVLPF